MVVDYVNKYRSMNAGKFPAACNVRKQVGGSHHTVKVIIQELQHNSKLSALATAANSSTIGQTAQVNGTSDAEFCTGCQMSDHSIAVEDYGNSAESDIIHGEVVDRNLYHKVVDMSNSNKNQEITADYLLGSEGKAFVESVREQDKISSCKEMSDDSINLKSQEVPVVSSMVENMPSNQTVTTSDLDMLAKPDHLSVATKRSKKSESADIDQAYTFESDEVTRGPTSQKTEDKKLQESSLWGNLKGFANNIINLWRKT